MVESKPTSEEKVLNRSQIDASVWVRVSTRILGIWYNWRVSSGSLRDWILSQIIIPPTSLQLQSDWTQTNTSSVSYVRNKTNTLSGTYSQIVAFLAAGIDLTIYDKVLITDFQTIYDQPDFDNAGAPKAPITKTSAVTEPLLINLLDANTLQLEAYSALYPEDQIHYDITFSVTEVNGTAAKGRITERIDHLNNRTDYDHRHVLFLRYESAPASGIFNQYKDNGGTSAEYLTFQFAAETPTTGFSNNNYIGDYAMYFLAYANPFLLSNNVFQKDAERNIIGNVSYNNTFGITAANNTFGELVYNNIIGDGATSNRFFNSINDNVFGNQLTGCYFGNGVFNNTFGDGFDGNFLGIGGISNSTFGDSISKNQFCGDVNFIIIGNGAIYNVFDFNISLLIFVDNLTKNHFKSDITSIDFTLATHVYAAYHCDIFFNSASVAKLSYIDGAGLLTVVNPNS